MIQTNFTNYIKLFNKEKHILEIKSKYDGELVVKFIPIQLFELLVNKSETTYNLTSNSNTFNVFYNDDSYNVNVLPSISDEYILKANGETITYTLEPQSDTTLASEIRVLVHPKDIPWPKYYDTTPSNSSNINIGDIWDNVQKKRYS